MARRHYQVRLWLDNGHDSLVAGPIYMHIHAGTRSMAERRAQIMWYNEVARANPRIADRLRITRTFRQATVSKTGPCATCMQEDPK